LIRTSETAGARRRRFLKGTVGAAVGIVGGTTLSILGAHDSWARESAARGGARTNRGSDYGDVRPVADITGQTVLALPEGFQYATFSKTGEAYAPGLRVARNHDGMACFEGARGIVRLIRNHEMRNPAGDFTLGIEAPLALRYDAKAMGGCMTLDFDVARKRLVRQFIGIGGTMVNCAGGYSHRNAGWLTCEETTQGVPNGFEKPHGYCFLVPASGDSAVSATPLRAMGRFLREAATADARGVVYQTEDADNTSGFYRFIPNRPDDLRAGRLQMLAIRGNAAADLFTGQTVGARRAVQWVDIGDPDPQLETGAPGCFAQGRSRGGAAFNRLEGIYRGDDGVSMYFLSTSGGEKRAANGAGYGQLWRYAPADPQHRKEDELVLVFESPAGSVLDSPDNLCVTPSGGILFCEDDAIGDADTHPLARGLKEVNRLVGLGRTGEPFTFAVNLLNASEFAGACYSPDGQMLFVNIYGDATPGSGMTCAIWGPWERGPL